ncbi:MAG TPA: NTP transferase domain-containing protein, partial [Myxococcota bacterium]|nr:NTP transferase domain-containing protein [Myxococcota bacterium]
MDTSKPLGAVGVVGVVLAGGRSRRFGVDKARVEVGGVPLVVRTARLLSFALSEVL